MPHRAFPAHLCVGKSPCGDGHLLVVRPADNHFCLCFHIAIVFARYGNVIGKSGLSVCSRWTMLMSSASLSG